jgi:putative replication protein rep
MKKKFNNTNEKKEILVYHNDFNTIKIGGFTKNRLNFFIGICYKVMGQGTNTVVLTFDEISKICDFKRKITIKEFEEEIIKMNEELIEKNLKFRRKLESGNYETTQLVLFPTFITNPDTRTLTVEVNEKFKILLNTFNKDFTELDLKKFVNLKSKYSQLLYKDLMQYKYSGYRVIKISELIDKLNIPQSFYNIKNGEITYKITAISLRILDKVQDELKDILENFSYKYIVMEKKGEVKRGRKKFTHIEFTFKPIRESIQNKDIQDIAVAEVVENKTTEITEEESNAKQEIDRIDLQIIIYKNALDSLKEIEITEELQERLDFFNKEILKLEQEKEKVRKLAEKFDEKIEKMIETQENTSDIVNKINKFSEYWHLESKHKEKLIALTNKFTGEEIEKELERINVETEKRAEIDRLKYVKTCVNNAESEITKRLKKAEKKAKAVAEAEKIEKITEDETIDNIDNFLGKYKI